MEALQYFKNVPTIRIPFDAAGAGYPTKRFLILNIPHKLKFAYIIL